LEPTAPSSREELEKAATQYGAAMAGSHAAEYLAGRGLSEETVRTHRIGVVADAMPGHSKYGGMLAIPYLAIKGYPVALRFRCMEEHNHRENSHGKYNSMPHDPPRLYNSRIIPTTGAEIHVTEGEFDALILNQLGMPAVAIAGANTFPPRHRILLQGFSQVWLWGDGDDSGAEMNSKIGRSLRQARAIAVPKGKDVNALYLDGGPILINQLLAKAKAQLSN
jgi:DNA primase